MAISTTNGKLAIMVLEDVWEPAFPIADTGTLGTDDKQHFLWGFPEVLWGAPPLVVAAAGTHLMLTGCGR